MLSAEQMQEEKHQSELDERNARAEMWRVIVSVLHVLKRGLEKEFDRDE